MVDGLVIKKLTGHDGHNHLATDEFGDLLLGHRLGVLRGDHDRGDPSWSSIDIFDSDLTLAVGAKPVDGTLLADVG